MSTIYGFDRFVGLEAEDAPDLVRRMSKQELGIDGERYGIFSRLLARPQTSVVDLATVVVRKLLSRVAGEAAASGGLGALVLSSRIFDVQQAASEIVDRLDLDCPADGIERACSGFPAATRVGLKHCRQTQRPVIVVAAEVISGNINWEPPDDSEADHHRARGQASKLFGDGAAAVLIRPGQSGTVHEILDAWIDDVPDDKQLIQKAEIEDTRDPWGVKRPGQTGCISMPGRRGFYLVKRAPEIMADSVGRCLQQSFQSLPPDPPLTHVVPHQANGLIIDRLQKRLAGEGHPCKVWDCIRDCGNTVSASIPLAMCQVQEQISPGSLVAMPSVGAGGPGYRPDVLSTGCVLVRTGDLDHGHERD